MSNGYSRQKMVLQRQEPIIEILKLVPTRGRQAFSSCSALENHVNSLGYIIPIAH